MTAAIDLDRVARRHGIRLLLQFGSSVTGKTHPGSDVDLAVLLERPALALEEYADLVHELQALFPGREVDLAVINHADPLFLKQVTDTCRLLHGAPGDLQRLKLLAFKRYQDHRRYLELERRFVADALSRPGANG
jgi:predicted nucleotidyltransferase